MKLDGGVRLRRTRAARTGNGKSREEVLKVRQVRLSQDDNEPTEKVTVDKE